MAAHDIDNLIRQHADGELGPEDRKRLEAHLAAHPEDRPAVEFERRLRLAIGRVMGTVEMPADLARQVQLMVAAQSDDFIAAPASSRPRSAMTPDRPSRTIPKRRMPSGLALGVMALITVAMLIGLWGDGASFRPLSPSQRADVQAPESAIRVGAYPVDEHVRCEDNAEHVERKMVYRTLDDVRRHLHDTLDWPVEVPDLSGFGYRFLDAGDCTIPPQQTQSVHLRYAGEGVTLSLWIQKVSPSALGLSSTLVEGEAYLVEPVSVGRYTRAAYFAWSSDGYVYRLLPSGAPQAREIARTIGMPDVEPQIVR